MSFNCFKKVNGDHSIDVQSIEDLKSDLHMIHSMGGNFQSEFTHDIEQVETITTGRYSISLHKYMGLGLYE
jgi:hypothetical protein